MIYIKPCAHCGGDAYIQNKTCVELERHREIRVMCNKCKVSTGFAICNEDDVRGTLDEMSEAWNTRHTTEAQIEAAAKAICWNGLSDWHGENGETADSHWTTVGINLKKEYVREAKAALKAAQDV